MDSRRFTTLLLISGLVTTLGCAGRSPLAMFKSSSSSSRTANRPSNQISMGGRGLGQPRPEQNTGISGAFKAVSNNISEALTIEPKVIPADDPIRLSSRPERIDPDVFILTARNLENRNQIVEAKKQYRKALATDPDNLTALVGLGRLYDRQGRYDSALLYYRQAIAKHPHEAGTYNDLGLCLARKGDIRSSIDALHEAVRLNPQKVLYRNNLATVLVEAGRPNEALPHLMAAHKPAIAHYNLGFLLHKRNDHAAARQQFQLAAQSDPQFTPARNMLRNLAVAAPFTPAPPNNPTANPGDNEVIRLPSAQFIPTSSNAAEAPTPGDFYNRNDYSENPQPLPRIE